MTNKTDTVNIFIMIHVLNAYVVKVHSNIVF